MAQAAVPTSVSLKGVCRADAAAVKRNLNEQSFTCLDGSKTIPVASFNDDYCDCEDGSDEPGTAACTNGSFCCRNKGFREKRIASAHVGDSLCDCCDGSDEFAGWCQDTCAEDAAAFNAEVQGKVVKLSAGLAARREYVQQAVDGLKQREADVAAKQAEVQSAKDALTAAEETVKVEEAKEAELEKQRNVYEESIKSLRLDELTVEQLRTLVVRLTLTAEAHEQVVDILSTGEFLDMSAEKLAPAWVVPPKEKVKTDEGTAARQAAQDAKVKLNVVQRELDEMAKGNDVDFGPDKAFYPLFTRCMTKTVAQYKYSVCPFKDAKQDHTSLGTFSGWQDGYKVMMFEHGQSCWNGPQRSLKVFLECGDTDELQGIDEPATCVYSTTLRTPAACSQAMLDELTLSSGSGEADDAEL